MAHPRTLHFALLHCECSQWTGGSWLHSRAYFSKLLWFIFTVLKVCVVRALVKYNNLILYTPHVRTTILNSQQRVYRVRSHRHTHLDAYASAFRRARLPINENSNCVYVSRTRMYSTYAPKSRVKMTCLVVIVLMWTNRHKGALLYACLCIFVAIYAFMYM